MLLLFSTYIVDKIPLNIGKMWGVKLNFIFHEDIISIMKKILNKRGIINLGGPTQSVYNFAKKYNKKVKKISVKKLKKLNFPTNASMNLNKLKKLLKKRT